MIKLMQLSQTTGSLEAGAIWRAQTALLEPQAPRRWPDMVANDHDLTLVEIRAVPERRFDVTVGLSTSHRMLRRLGLRLRKSR
ncbi:MAG: winged helix-turn-helix domain-containing protein [Alphaproteobacteria bacterium]